MAPTTTEMFAPAMRSAAQEMSRDDVEWSTALFLAVSVPSHFVHGLLVSRVGERYIYAFVAYALLVYIGSCWAIFEDACPFMMARMLQSVGASGCTVVGFALIRIKLLGRNGVARVNTARALTLVVVPMCSETVVDAWNWRGSFLAMAALGIMGLICTSTVACKDTKPQHTPGLATQSRRGCVEFVMWVLSETFGFAAMFVWISYAPFLEFRNGFGYAYGVTFLGSALGSFLAAYTRPMRGFLVATAAMSLTVIACMAGGFSAFVWMFLFNTGRGIASAHAQTGVLRHGSSAGTASGIMHAMRTTTAALAVLIGLYVPPWLLMLALTISSAVPVMMLHVFDWRKRSSDTATNAMHVVMNAAVDTSCTISNDSCAKS